MLEKILKFGVSLTLEIEKHGMAKMFQALEKIANLLHFQRVYVAYWPL